MGRGFVIVLLPAAYSGQSLRIFDGERFSVCWNDIKIFKTLDQARRMALRLSSIRPVDILRINLSLGDHVGTVRPSAAEAVGWRHE